MKSWEREVHTHLDLVERFVGLAGLPDDEAKILVRELRRYMEVRLKHRRWLPGEITRLHSEWYRELYRTLGIADPYVELKRRSDELAASVIAGLDVSTFSRALRASIVANRLDFGVAANDPDKMPVAAVDFDGLDALEMFVDDADVLERRVGDARRLLYLLDNHGEARFDLEVLARVRAMRPELEIVVAGKASPMINDVTADEAKALGFERYARVISTGTNSFGLPEEEVSAELVDVWRSADVVIAKGQAMLEFWIERSVDKVFNAAHTKFRIHDAVLGEIPPAVNLVLHGGRYGSADKSTFPAASPDGGERDG